MCRPRDVPVLPAGMCAALVEATCGTRNYGRYQTQYRRPRYRCQFRRYVPKPLVIGIAGMLEYVRACCYSGPAGPVMARGTGERRVRTGEYARPLLMRVSDRRRFCVYTARCARRVSRNSGYRLRRRGIAGAGVDSVCPSAFYGAPATWPRLVSAPAGPARADALPTYLRRACRGSRCGCRRARHAPARRRWRWPGRRRSAQARA